jgi:hypothetical protein
MSAAPVARVLVAGEVGMDGPGDVAKQLADGVGGEARRVSGAAIDGGGVKAGARAVGDLLRQLAELGFAMSSSSRSSCSCSVPTCCWHRAANMSRSRSMRSASPRGRRAPPRARHPRAQSIEVVLGLIGTDERGHPGMIPARSHREARMSCAHHRAPDAPHVV